jgi:hypothetical protein
MSIESCYINFCNFVRNLDELGDFKSSHIFQGILEHVSLEQGNEYLYYIKKITEITDHDIQQYCHLNDMYGGGIKHNFGFITTSPSNLRYILHSYLILRHIQSLNLNDVDIVEVGGGYGGLCLAINYFSKLYNINIKSYTIIDLPELIRLQNMYLSKHSLSFPLTYLNAFNYGKDIDMSNMFLISNYCFSEISAEHQRNYINFLFHKVSHGFMAWNHIPLYNFGFSYRYEVEYPLTGSTNNYVYF